MSLKEFQILGQLGRGSFGIVYKVRRKQTGQICVLKAVQMSRLDKKMKKWAINQATIMKEIKSQYIVRYLLSFMQKQKFYICMQFCSGGDLAQLLKSQMGKPLQEDLIWKFIIQIMLGIRDLHEKKILHRDIKTLNIFLTENKQIRIGDLGVARNMTGQFANTVVGTPYYLSPQMCEQKPYNQKTDVWAMGCLFYQLCTSKHPFQANSQAALALKIVVGKYNPIPSHFSQTIKWLIKICLQVDYKRRPTINYILTQPQIIKIANKIGIQLNQRIQLENKPQSKPQLIEKVIQIFNNKPPLIKKIEQKNQMPKKSSNLFRNEMKKQKKQSLDNNKNQNKSRDKSNKANQKQIKKQAVKGKVQVYDYRNIPISKKQQIPGLIKKVESTQKLKEFKHEKQKIVKQENNNNIIKIQSKSQIVQKAEQKLIVNKDNSGQALNGNKIIRKSCQQLVDDDQLFQDFGITPEKLTNINQKVQFKKVNTINWNVMNNQKQLQEVLLPTIKTPSTCQLISIQCKQIDDNDQLIAEQLDDNIPYKSDQQSCGQNQNQFEGENKLLIQDDEIEDEDELKMNQKMVHLQRKIVQNQKRKQQLIQLKNQNQSQILKKINKQKFDRIRNVIREGSELQIEKLASKELTNSINLIKFYKILHFDIEIDRCNQNIQNCNQLIGQFKK